MTNSKDEDLIIRYVIEQITGITTGSDRDIHDFVYDKMTRVYGFKGEA
jgi:hypothetical protein